MGYLCVLMRDKDMKNVAHVFLTMWTCRLHHVVEGLPF